MEEIKFGKDFRVGLLFSYLLNNCYENIIKIDVLILNKVYNKIRFHLKKFLI